MSETIEQEQDVATGAPTNENMRFFDPHIETLPRADIRRLQELRLLETLPKIYERSALIRKTWDEAGVTPADINSLGDYLSKAPFIDKDSIRAHRDAYDDPCGGVRIADYSEILHVGFTSGTTGDPTPVPNGRSSAIDTEILREFWHMGGRPGDYVTYLMFTFRGGIARTSFLTEAGFSPIVSAHDPAVIPLMIEAIETYRPTVLYMVSTPMMIGLERYFETSGKDPRKVFQSIKGAVFGGEPMSPHFAALAKSWGLEIFDYTTLGDVAGAMECSEHNGFHGWEDLALIENLDPQGKPVPDGELGEMVVTALADPLAPLVRFRTGDLVKLDHAPCRCGRTHVRFWVLGRLGDQTIVNGTSILPRDIQRIVEQEPATRSALFQIIRPQPEMDKLRLRVGYDSERLTGTLDALAARLADSVSRELEVPSEIELVPAEDLLKLGPPQKIPRVTKS